MNEAYSLWNGQLPPEAFRTEISGFRKFSEAVVVGILFKEHKTRSNVIDQFKKNPLSSRLLSEETAEGKIAEPGSLCSDGDALYLEDGTMRLKLTVQPQLMNTLCSGLVAAVRGTPSEEGGFVVSSVVFSRLEAPPPLGPLPASTAEGPFVAFVSGLAPDDGEAFSGDKYDKLVEFVSKSTEPIKEVVVCGGGLCTKPGQIGKVSSGAIASADDVLSKLSASCTVRIMPGSADPTNYSLPQMALHPLLFRKARSLQCVSNPFSGVVDGSALKILGHSGQPVNDILRCTVGTTALSSLRLCLESLHLAPTAPDTLATPPYQDKDPFIVEEVPHVLFSGGHDQEAHEWIRAPRGDEERCGTQLVCVPAFHKEPKVVLVNVHDPRDVRVHDVCA